MPDDERDLHYRLGQCEREHKHLRHLLGELIRSLKFDGGQVAVVDNDKAAAVMISTPGLYDISPQFFKPE